MKIRVKFSKQGSMRYIGHLDLMRYFQKIFRMINLPVEYSKGFNPHQIMSFASPLGVGMTSSGEYLDVRLGYNEENKETLDLKKLLETLNNTLNKEIRIRDIKEIKEEAKTSMSVLGAADYLIFGKKEYMPLIKFHNFEHFMTQNEIIIAKEGKKGKSLVNISPYIYEFKLYLPGSPEYERAFNTYEDAYPSKEDGMPVIYLKASAGSAFHVKPYWPVMAYFESFKEKFESSANFQIPLDAGRHASHATKFEKIYFHYHRLDMYAILTEKPENGLSQGIIQDKKLISMNEFGVVK